ncbi:hypothetical protein F4819DRAFT_483806 [Hypoxylon fuscum]|nr:hypothetical protein F4819DRAFT_483806 [Hypoxylon fuscum]
MPSDPVEVESDDTNDGGGDTENDGGDSDDNDDGSYDLVGEDVVNDDDMEVDDVQGEDVVDDDIVDENVDAVDADADAGDDRELEDETYDSIPSSQVVVLDSLNRPEQILLSGASSIDDDEVIPDSFPRDAGIRGSPRANDERPANADVGELHLGSSSSLERNISVPRRTTTFLISQNADTQPQPVGLHIMHGGGIEGTYLVDYLPT